MTAPTLTLRELGDAPKGEGLTNAEVDQNFLNLQAAVVALEQSAAVQSQSDAFMAAIIYG